MGKYFGTDGFRGAANEDLTALHAYKVGRYLGYFYADKLNRKVKVVIGKDTRISGDMLKSALVAGLASSGADSVDIGVISTPGVAYISTLEEFDCGIMISASHNPYYDNGIKIFDGDGTKLRSSVEAKIEEYIDGEIDSLPLVSKELVGKVIIDDVIKESYLKHLRNTIDGDLSGIKIGLDAANGAVYDIARELFESLKAEVHVINNNPDGYNINEKCGSTHPEALQEFVVSQKLDLGLAFDGDADRLIAVDHQGNLVDGDRIIYICGKDLKSQGRLKDDTVVITVMSNLGLNKALDEAGIKYSITDVGDKYVQERMDANSYVIGGEQSGHIIFNEYASTGDGMLTGLQIVNIMKKTSSSLSELASPVKNYPQLLVNVRVEDKDYVMTHELVLKAAKEVELLLDGNGRLLLRPSGTEPLIRIMVEAATDESCKQCVEIIKNVIDKI